MNSRLLCALSNGPSDLTYLIPRNFLIGTSLTAYPEKNTTDIFESNFHLGKNVLKFDNFFGKICQLNIWTDLNGSSNNLKINDIVFKEDQIRPLNSPVCRIIKTFPGNHKKVRVVKLCTKEGIFTLSLAKLCLLPINWWSR